ncbi:MAG: EamA family transporter [Acidobacteria bacterium]|nr:EamA family transporter [Acidobacteriota bacterium]
MPSSHTFAIVLVLLSAALHAGWNLIVKGQDEKLVSAWFTVVIPPLVLWPVLWITGPPSARAWPIVAGSGAIHTAYNVALARAYEHGNLSLVYPVARGLAPLLVALAAPIALGDRLSADALAAIGGITCGIIWLGFSARHDLARGPALRWATLTAGFIACYTLVDTVGVRFANPLAYTIVLYTCNATFMTPYVLRHRGWSRVKQVGRGRLLVLMASGLCSLGAYALVLVALRLVQVSYVAALRESSVIIGAFLGWMVLKERFGPQRILASALVTLGLILLSLAMRQ